MMPEPELSARRRAHGGRLLRRRDIAERLVSLETLRRAKVVEPDGASAGTLGDVVVAFDGEDRYPPVTGIIVAVGGRQAFAPIADVARLDRAGVTLARPVSTLAGFERRRGEVALVADVLGRQLVDVDGVKVLRAHDVFLAPVGGRLRLVAVAGGKTPRGVPRVERLVDWAAVQPFGEPGSQLRFRVPHEGLHRLRPGKLAEVLEHLDRSARDELASTLSPATVADALEEMEPKTTEAFLRESPPARAASLLAAMEPDEAVDALRDLDYLDANQILAELPPETSRRLTELLGYPEAMAGGFMTPTLAIAHLDDTVAQVRQKLVGLQEHREDLDAVAVADEAGRVVGDVGLFDLLVADPGTLVRDLLDGADPITVRADAFLDEVVDRLREARSRSIVVVDEDEHPLGRILADDVLDALKEGGLKARLPWLLH
jgi:CBS domain-containing protein